MLYNVFIQTQGVNHRNVKQVNASSSEEAAKKVDLREDQQIINIEEYPDYSSIEYPSYEEHIKSMGGSACYGCSGCIYADECPAYVV